jgi:hypothetical protein
MYHLHQSYNDILAMPVRRRRRILELLQEQKEFEEEAIKNA